MRTISTIIQKSIKYNDWGRWHTKLQLTPEKMLQNYKLQVNKYSIKYLDNTINIFNIFKYAT